MLRCFHGRLCACLATFIDPVGDIAIAGDKPNSERMMLRYRLGLSTVQITHDLAWSFVGEAASMGRACACSWAGLSRWADVRCGFSRLLFRGYPVPRTFLGKSFLCIELHSMHLANYSFQICYG
jgi:hypothetical protein